MRSLHTSCVVAIALLAFSAGCSREAGEYHKMLSLAKDEPQQAEQIAHDLRNTKEGIQLALRDFSCLAGRKYRLASWMLLTSSINTNVEAPLNAIISDRSQPVERKIEASWILWGRTGDFNYLDSLFILVNDAGGPATTKGRSYLLQAINPKAPKAKEFRFALDVPDTVPLRMSVDEFRRLSRTPGAVILNAKDASQF